MSNANAGRTSSLQYKRLHVLTGGEVFEDSSDIHNIDRLLHSDVQVNTEWSALSSGMTGVDQDEEQRQHASEKENKTNELELVEEEEDEDDDDDDISDSNHTDEDNPATNAHDASSPDEDDFFRAIWKENASSVSADRGHGALNICNDKHNHSTHNAIGYGDLTRSFSVTPCAKAKAGDCVVAAKMCTSVPISGADMLIRSRRATNDVAQTFLSLKPLITMKRPTSKSTLFISNATENYNEDDEDDENDENDDNSVENQREPLLSELNLSHQNGLLYLIERNRANQIFCPFDELAYFKICGTTQRSKHGAVFGKRRRLEQQTSHDSSFSSTVNSKTTTATTTTTATSSLFWLTSAAQLNSVLPCSVSSLLMVFFFDIFQASELRQCAPSTISIMMRLKNSYQPILRLDEAAKMAHMTENVLWSCFALFKRNFAAECKTNFFNYFVCLFNLSKHLEWRVTPQAHAQCSSIGESQPAAVCQKKARQLKLALPFYLEALVLSGCTSAAELLAAAQRIVRTQRSLTEHHNGGTLPAHTDRESNASVIGSLQAECAEQTEQCVKTTLSCIYPLSLASLSRVCIKRAMGLRFGVSSVRLLRADEKLTRFLLFDLEFERFYEALKDCF